jgi:retron-type reverse transcriptase
MSQTKPIEISKYEVEEAYKRVKANKGSAGIDHQGLQDFDADKDNNLYKLWNRLSSGSYMPPPVLRVEIPKGDGGTRALGIPTITDRIAQMVVKQRIEPELEMHFHPNSYGYRPLHFHYRIFFATTHDSAPVFCIGICCHHSAGLLLVIFP